MPTFLQIECPGCKAVLQVEESLAGRQGKCIHCGHKIVVPRKDGVPVPPPPPVPFLTEASPEAMVRELHDRKKSAILLVFEPAADGSYDLSGVPDNKLKCIATEDINQPRFAQLVASFTKRFAAKPQPSAPTAPSAAQSSSGDWGTATSGPDQPYELKGDRLGMSLADFKERYARFSPLTGQQELPICSDQPGYVGKAELHSEAWHRVAKIIHARVDNPNEDNSPTVAGVKTDLMLYQFIDDKLFRIWALFPTDLFHVVSDAVTQKFGPATHESKQPRELGWENAVSRIVLARGAVHPRTPSTLQLVHNELLEVAESRTPKGAADI